MESNRANVDFTAASGKVADLAAAIKMKYQRLPMPPDALQASVTGTTRSVDSGERFSANRSRLQDRHPPFYAACHARHS